MIRLHDLGFGPKLSMDLSILPIETLNVSKITLINSFMILKELVLIKLIL